MSVRRWKLWKLRQVVSPGGQIIPVSGHWRNARARTDFAMGDDIPPYQAKWSQ